MCEEREARVSHYFNLIVNLSEDRLVELVVNGKKEEFSLSQSSLGTLRAHGFPVMSQI